MQKTCSILYVRSTSCVFVYIDSEYMVFCVCVCACVCQCMCVCVFALKVEKSETERVETVCVGNERIEGGGSDRKNKN